MAASLQWPIATLTLVCVCILPTAAQQTTPHSFEHDQEISVSDLQPSAPEHQTPEHSQPTPLDDLFERSDKDHDGFLSKPEFRSAAKELIQSYKDEHNWLASVGALGNGEGFLPAFLNSLVMIWATELGDKTFFIAAILAMRHARAVVFLGALGALAVMTVLSAALGFALPNVMPRTYTHYASGVLFLFFGLQLLNEGRKMDGGISDEYEEAEQELQQLETGATDQNSECEGLMESQEAAEDGAVQEAASSGVDADPPAALMTPLKILTSAFTLTFIAEWGDRSQIATVALAADKNPFGVTLGGILGHACCTGLAVLSGKFLAERISERTTTLVGGTLFLVFAVHTFVTQPE